jgi:hypothetical protein
MRSNAARQDEVAVEADRETRPDIVPRSDEAQTTTIEIEDADDWRWVRS